MYEAKKKITLVTLNQELKDRAVIDFSTASLHKLLPLLGFKYKKDSNRRYLIENPNVALLRTEFLRTYKQNMDSPNPRVVVFMDETWIFAKGNPRKSWQDNSIKSIKRRAGYEGKRFIVVDCGDENGFIKNAGITFASKSKTGDYHGEIKAVVTWSVFAGPDLQDGKNARVLTACAPAV